MLVFPRNLTEQEFIDICAIRSNDTHAVHWQEMEKHHERRGSSEFLDFLLKKLTSLGWEVKRMKGRHQEPQKYEVVWATFNRLNVV